MESLTTLPIEWWVLFGFVATGIAAGFAAGVFGIGGGIIGVPALVYLLPLAGVPAQRVMHLAIGSSLAAILFTSGSAAWNHHRRDAVDLASLRVLVPGLLVGALAGSSGARFLDAEVLRVVFGVFACGVAVWLMFGRDPAPRQGPARGVQLVAFGIGVLAALVGVGGGILLVPWLMAHGATAQRAVGTSAAATLPVALAGAVGYALSGLGTPGLPVGATGFVYWPAVAAMAIGSFISARWGVAVAHRAASDTLRRMFAVLVMLMGVNLTLG